MPAARTIMSWIGLWLISAVLFLGGVIYLGLILDVQGERAGHLSACLKGADNGLAIERCKRDFE